MSTLSELTTFYHSDTCIVETVPVGEINRVNLQVAIKEGMNLAKTNNCHSLLFDIRNCFVLRSFIEGFTDMAKFGSIMGVGQEYCCAVFYDTKTYPEERAELIESVANTMINPPFRMFKSRSEAVNWLIEMQPANSYS